MIWTDDEANRLQELLANGVSLSQCGRELRKSRGSVAGKMHREGWFVGRAGVRRMRNHAPRPRPSRAPEDAPKRFSIDFDLETYEQIKALAKRERASLAEAVRLLVEWGLEAEAAQ